MTKVLMVSLVVILGGCAKAPSTHEVAYPNGTVRWRQTLVGGVPHGKSETFHPNGLLRSSGVYHRGSRRGHFVFFSEDGVIEKQVLYLDDEILWETADQNERPPAQLARFIRNHGEGSRDVTEVESEPTASTVSLSNVLGAARRGLTEGSPSSQFAGLERVTGRNLLGFSAGAGGASTGNSLTRLSLYGNYEIRSLRDNRIGLYADFATSRLATMETSYEGRRSLELSMTHRRPVLRGAISSRLGLLVPIGNDTQHGAAIAAASSIQRPTDSVAAMPSTVALRGGSSWSKSGEFWVVQGDAYLDIAAGGAQNSFHPLGRINAAIGLGGEDLMVGFESVNTLRLDDSADSVRSLGVSVLMRFSGVAVSLLMARTGASLTSFTGGISHEI